MPEDISWPSQIACVMMENQKCSRSSGLSLRSVDLCQKSIVIHFSHT